jgi:mannose-6-phosphate isomerase-like protein (cupin superfamily)
LRKIQSNGSLLTNEELDNIFFNYDLHDKNSFFIIDKNTKTYQTNRKRESFVDDAALIRKCYEDGHTIVIKNMEHFNASIQEAAQELGEGTDVHLYLTPEGGDSFEYHTDDRDVWVKMVRGKKMFVKRYTGMTTLTKLEENQCLFIREGLEHRAVPIGPSALLSFGVLETNRVTIESHCKNRLKT